MFLFVSLFSISKSLSSIFYEFYFVHIFTQSFGKSYNGLLPSPPPQKSPLQEFLACMGIQANPFTICLQK
jgi:hypothetical protein